MSVRFVLCLSAAVVALATAGSWAQRGEEIARPRLIAEHEQLIPGQVNYLAVVWEIRKGWHTYWPGQNVTSFQQTFEVHGPEGFRIDEPIWPGPKRYFPAEGLLDHVYEKQAVVLIPVHVPAEPPPWRVFPFSVRLDYLVCEEQCIPGSAEVRIELPISREPERSTDAALIETARARAPKPWPGSPEAGLGARWVGDSVEFRARGAVRLAFMPGLASIPPTKPIEDGEKEGDRLVVRFESNPGSAQGLLAVWSKPDTDPVFYRVNLTKPGA